MVVTPHMPLRDFFHGLHQTYAAMTPLDFWNRGATYSDWHYYEGPDCEPINFYLRFGRDRLVVANMNGYKRPSGREKIMSKPLLRAGRMPVILNSLDKLAPRVVFESVINPYLPRYLQGHGFKPTEQLTYGASYLKEFDVPMIEVAGP